MPESWCPTPITDVYKRQDPCWFFITLFQVMIVACMIKLPQKGVREKSIIGLLSFILGAIFYKLSIDYFGITKLCIAFGYLSMGTLIRDLSVKIRHSYINVPLYITGVLGIVWFFTAILNGKISMYTVDLGNYVLFLMASVSGLSLIHISLKNTNGIIVISPNTNYCLSPSSFYDKYQKKAFTINNSDTKMLHLGFPCLDELFNNDEGDLHKLTTKSFSKVIIWMPTFRVGGGCNRSDVDYNVQLGVPLLASMQQYGQLNDCLLYTSTGREDGRGSPKRTATKR